MEMQYANYGDAFGAAEGNFLDFFDGLTHAPLGYAQAGQECLYWPMNAHAYKFGEPSEGDTPYYSSSFGTNHHFLPSDANRQDWECPLSVPVDESSSNAVQHVGNTVSITVQERIIEQEETSSSSQAVWQDDIDPDNMTYEELLDLGEALGCQSRGLSLDHISLLPICRYKCRRFFSRKRSKERCVICQARYRSGERQMKLPCKHVYHAQCITKWLTINKVCPVCGREVLGEESTSHDDVNRC